jgi:hypothetical protein
MPTYRYKHPDKVKAVRNSVRGPKREGHVTSWGHYRTGPVICGLIQKFKLKSFVEMGACGCQLSETVLVEFPDVKVYSVDLTFGPNSNRAGTLTIAPIERLKNEYGDRFTAIEKPSLEAAHEFADHSLDIVYIDAGHLYHQVLADIKVWRNKVRHNGILSGHDYGHGQNKGVKKAVDEIYPDIKVADYYNWWRIMSDSNAS